MSVSGETRPLCHECRQRRERRGRATQRPRCRQNMLLAASRFVIAFEHLWCASRARGRIAPSDIGDGMRLISLFVAIGAMLLQSAFAQERRPSDIGTDIAVFTEAVRDWTPAAFQGYLDHYPEGARAEAARRALETLVAPPTIEQAGVALDGLTPADWNCGDLPSMVARIVPLTGVDALQQLADADDPRAQTLLGFAKSYGLVGFRRDVRGGRRLIQAASDAGFPPAQANQGDWLRLTNPSESVRLLQLASDAGNGCGQVGLAIWRRTGGGGLEADDGEVVRLYALAAAQGNAHAQANLGNLYRFGQRGLERDEAEAVRLLTLSALQGNDWGQALLADFYYSSKASEQDIEEAGRLFTLAAASGNAFAQYRLGLMTLNGEGGISLDQARGLELLRAAADQGNAPARDYLRQLGRR